MSNASPYGWDLSCVSDLDPQMTEVGGNLVLVQACARRLITPRGTLCDDANYGYDLTQFLGADLSPADVARIQGQVSQELLKDERILSVASIVVLSVSTAVLTVTVVIQATAGPLQFVLSITSLAATILAVSP